MTFARQLVANPANKQQRYIFYSNGYIEPKGGALPVQQAEASINDWPAQDAPLFLNAAIPDQGARIQVIDWTVPSGYTLDIFGLIWPWGGTAVVPGAVGSPFTTAPDFLFGGNGGFQTIPNGFVIDFAMDPAGNGRGYFLQINGDLLSFGTGVTAVSHTNFLTDAAARHLEMDWASKRYWVFDNKNRIWGRNGANNVGIDGLAALTYVPTYDSHGGRLYDKAATPKGWDVDVYGRVHRIGTAQDPAGYPPVGSADFATFEDLEIVDDGTGVNPLRLAMLQSTGRIVEYVVSTAPVAWVNNPSGTTTVSTRPYIDWTYFDLEGDAQAAYAARIITDAVYLTAVTNEVQRITITGTPTGGGFILGLTHNGQTTVTSLLAFNASNAAIDTALEALNNVGAGNITVSGGPLPGTPVSITFTNELGAFDIQQMTALHNFTGGSSPNIAITTTTPGVGIDPSTAAAVWETSGTDQAVRRVRPTVDLANDTYRAYVKVTDTSGKTNGFIYYKQFTVNVTALNAPTVTPSVQGGVGGVSLLVHATVGGGLPGTARFGVQYHDSDWDGSTWLLVRNGDTLVPNGSGDATVVDYEARFGVMRSYRAITYVYDTLTDDWRATTGATVTATMTPQNVWVLSNPASVADARVVKVREFKTSAPILGQTFAPIGRNDPIVLTDGGPKFPSFPLKLWALDKATRNFVETVMASGAVLLLRDPFGNGWYFKAVNTFDKDLMRATATATESTPIRDANEVEATAQTVKRPNAGPTSGPLMEAVV